MLNVSNAGFMGEIWKRTRNESDIGDKGPVQLVFVEDIAVFVGGEVASVVPRLPEQAGQQWREKTGAEEGKCRELEQAGQQRAGLAGRRHAAVLQSSSELRSTNFSLQINSTTRKLTAVDRVSRSDRPTDRVRTLARAGLDSATQHASPRQPAADDATVETYYYGH